MLKLIGKLLAVVPDAPEEVTKSGIIVHVAKDLQERKQTNTGVVKYKGKGVEEDINIGDRVLYIEGTYWKNDVRTNPNETQDEDDTIVFVGEHEIYCVIE